MSRHVLTIMLTLAVVPTTGRAQPAGKPEPAARPEGGARPGEPEKKPEGRKPADKPETTPARPSAPARPPAATPAEVPPEKPRPIRPAGRLPDMPMCPPPAPCKCPVVKKDPRVTPVAGFTLGHRRLGVKFEVGYPFFVFELAYGFGSRFQMFVGYRGLYSLTSAPYGGFKILLTADSRRILGISLTAMGGWTHVRDGDLDVAMLVGSGGVFGEVWVTATARSGRHGGFVNGGVRLSQVEKCDNADDDCYDHPIQDDDGDGKKGALATIFGEVGYELYITRYVSYYLALGVDMFANSDAMPAMVRFRTGMIMHF